MVIHVDLTENDLARLGLCGGELLEYRTNDLAWTAPVGVEVYYCVRGA